MGWVVTADVFDRFLKANQLDPGEEAGPEFTERVRAGQLPRRTLRSRSHAARLGDAHVPVALLVPDEDRGDRAFPGVYESVPWDVEAGRPALGDALKEVWASYWSERAVEYRATAGPGPTPLRRLAVLVNVRVPHDDVGFASSADVRTGFTDRHLVKVATEGRESTSMHLLLPNVVSELAVTPEAPLDPRFVKNVS
jgi:hypothetical protein